ncbi:hypothetical protein BO94DRAFT_592154 [Aspergillus sclerotioniger CBS 115572]|uniref:Uncharacterized protein n=1 Tax=Aspergillus sclerotioniger CBS 115572 TaxID=1450535 RepID=A0A317XH69_9EURO|nr:hypothetical protein BO94DRAFT_592154 [Aspergillus sclerotioniger CBS 115572]PWY96440.1 hypothetical protein BO94DRAFT_592154 [Aspergillus sclerotioniger CBS 115572]
MAPKSPLFDRILNLLETGLDTTGAWKLAQRIRRIQQNRQGLLTAKEIEAITILLTNDFSRRMNAQYEGMFMERRATILKQLDHIVGGNVADNLEKELIAVELNLKELERYIGAVEKTYQSMLKEEGDKPFGRAIKAHWKRKNWQLSKRLRDDCAKRGGCCARGCGCCEKQRSELRPGVVGHCTFACACCEQARGEEVENYEVLDVCENYEILAKGNRRADSIMKAYVWGV